MKWRTISTSGFERGEKCCKANETFLRTTARSFTIPARQAFTVKRVNSEALALVYLVFTAGEAVCYHPGRSTTEVRGW